MSINTCFTPFLHAIDGIDLPTHFTFPFYYQPHPLCVLAAEQLQQHLIQQTDWQHNFGLTGELKGAIGKMFGVLLVQNGEGEVGFLAAFSGKLAEQNHWPHFVPPVFDMLADDSFFQRGNKEINSLNQQLEALESSSDLTLCQAALAQQLAASEQAIAAHRQRMISARKTRKALREKLAANAPISSSHDAIITIGSHSEIASTLSSNSTQKSADNPAIAQITKQLSQESVNEKNQLRDLKHYWDQQINAAQQQLNLLTDDIAKLRQQRKRLSASLQQKLFEQYCFLNIQGESLSLGEIFSATVDKTPPAGAGECAAPKLLHYAFKHQLTPLAMAEFWWGAPPKSEIRQHKQFYPACLRKCQPILSHMLKGLTVEDNPLLNNPGEGKILELLYQDEVMAIVNKPAEFLSVPGKDIEDSVYSRMKQQFPQATGPLIVHRLDMSTSGLMVIALTKEAHKQLQKQFIQRTVTKRYVALLSRMSTEMAQGKQAGQILLPLRGDLDDRPRQLVCHEFGKPAETHWQRCQNARTSDDNAQQTRVYLYPKTGRTHQLRMHCAHIQGLYSPIVGDDLYGIRGTRLHLHADMLVLKHPQSLEIMTFQVDADF